ncbi:ABC transporter substrate-binding protein [Cohnella ginsengisoli]|uniref:ABC transporter substrate-binding protein n=1 Tax=Cohnella ginsengisoli TaxID=425004 RepID=A0A9X4KKB1_9BACL|nr:extracellular solute-binding protein [Cohnella ginsengisoli]MDG0791355.1 ABC transporter substrate-binding protein [Cohnella ginsengisoli]
MTLTVQYPTADNPVWVTVADDQIKRFSEKFPNVTIKKNTWQYNPNEIGVKMAAHQAPSFFQTAATEGRTLVEHSWAADLTPYLEGYAQMDQINKSLLEPFTFDGKIYALPSDAYMMTVTLNKKLFETKNVAIPSPDWTWNEFYEAAKATADPAKGIAGFAIMAKGNEGGWQWTNLLYQAGGEAQKVEGGKVVSTFNSDAGVKAMEFLKKLRWEANALPQNWALNYGDTYNLFKQGRAAIVLGNAVEDAVNNGGMNKDDLVVLPMPAAEAGGEHVGIMGGNFFIVNPQETPDVQKAAFDYITNDYFTDSGVESLRMDLESRKSKNQVRVPNVANYYTQDSEYGKKMQAVYDAYPETVYKYDDRVYELAKGKTEPSYNGQDYYAALTNVMQEVLTDKNADVKKLLDAAATKFDSDFLSKITLE